MSAARAASPAPTTEPTDGARLKKEAPCQAGELPGRGVTATVTNSKPAEIADPGIATASSVVLRGLTVALDTDAGEAFIADCARNTEGLLTDREIKTKYELRDEDWGSLADNTPLLRAVRAERERRIQNGAAAREAAQRHFATAPTILNRILSDEQVAPRHRIEAARELRQVAGNGPSQTPGPAEKFVIMINLGGDDNLVVEKTLTPLVAAPTDNEEVA